MVLVLQRSRRGYMQRKSIIIVKCAHWLRKANGYSVMARFYHKSPYTQGRKRD